MIVEFPQADSCFGFLSLRIGVIIVVLIRIILFVLLVLFYAQVFPIGHGSITEETHTGHQCYNLNHVAKAELVMLVVTVTLLVLWLILMVPTVVWEAVSVILVGAVLELVIWVWFFFLMAYNITMCIIGEYVSFMLFYSMFWMAIECYVLWLMWSYYVDAKAELYRYEREAGRTISTDTESPSTTY